MSVKIAQKNIKFYSELVNGSNFDENTGSYTTALSDGVTGRCKAVATIEVEIGFNFNNFQILFAGSTAPATTGVSYKIVKDDFDFIAEGITIGGSAVIYVDSGAGIGAFAFDVLSVTGGSLFITLTGAALEKAAFYALVNNQANQNYESRGYISVVPSFTGLEFSYNLVENNGGSESLVSRLTNTTNVIKVKNIPTTLGGGTVTGSATSKNKAWVMGDVTVELSDKVFNNNVLGQAKHSNKYVIEHEFTIPYYYDGEDDNLEDTTVPPDLYNGKNSPKYIYQTTWFTDINDPNTGSTVKYSSSIGASGYLDEAFNGDANPYSVSDLVYTDLTEGITTDRLNIGKTTRVNFDVSNTESDFDASQMAVLVHGAVVDSSQYASNTNDFDSVWTFETLRAAADDGAPTTGTLINNYSITYNSTSSISIQFDVTFTAAQNAILEENQFYVLALQLRDDSESVVLNSHKVHLKIDFNQYGINNDIPGLFGVARFEQIPHPISLETDVISTTGYTNGQYNIEENGMSLIEFWLDTSKDAVLDTCDFQIVVFNKSDNSYSVLRETTIDVSNSVLVGNSWQISLNETVGYPLKEGDQFNYKKIVTGQKVGNKQFYTLLIGYRLPWQDWLKFAEAPTEFFDISKDNDGLNQNSSNYSTDADYQIRFLLDSQVSQDGAPTNYVSSSNDIKVFDYDEDDTGLETYTCSIGTFKEDGVALEDNIIQDGYTRIKSIYTPLVPPVFSETVDMTEVATAWSRFAHGNYYTKIDTFETRRLGLNNGVGWTNGQANISVGNDEGDTFRNTDNSEIRNKDATDLYTSSTSQILADQNLGAVYGCYSLLKYEFYQITGKMFSTSGDNDGLLYNIAFMVDEFGIEHSLSLAATTGGVAINNSYIPGDPTSDRWVYNPGGSEANCNVALVYDYGKDDYTILDQFFTTKVGLGWSAVGDLSFDVKRSEDDITIDVDWTITGDNYTPSFTYNLKDNSFTEKFRGFSNIGFAFHSQNQGGFKDVELAIPASDFWSTIRIEPELSSSDNALYELSNEREGDTSNLLKQEEGTQIVSNLDFDGTSFILSCLINTNRITSGQSYKLSSEIGLVNLGALELLTCFAWVEEDTPSVLNVMFNSVVEIVDTTGLSLVFSLGTPLTISSIASNSNNFISFNLSGDVQVDDVFTFDYDGTNNIEREDATVLSTGSINVYNDI